MHYTWIMSDYTYPDALLKKTKKRIKDQLEGQNCDLKTLSLTIKRQGQASFTARTSYKIECAVDTKSAAGKVVEGTLVGEGELAGHIEKAIRTIKSDDAIAKIAEEQIKKLPQQGFGADKEQISLGRGKEKITEHQTCRNCQGHAKMPCPTCYGKAYMQCNLCNGYGELQCMMCAGRGQIQNADGSHQTCTNCHGRGRTFCTQCQGQKQIPCTQCQAKGNVVCKSCQGAGAMSKIATIDSVLVTHAQINLQELEPEPKRLVSLATPEKLAAGGHMTIKVTDKPKPQKEDNKAWYEDEAPAPDTSGVYYAATIPWAVAELSLNNKTYEISFIGNKGAVAECKPFMDQVFMEPLKLISSAAKGEGLVAGLLKDACRYRVSRETLAAVARGRKKRALQDIMNHYGLGLSHNIAKALVMNSFQALKRVTRRPRYIGLGVGLILCAALNYLWFMGDMRELSMNSPQKTRYAIDGIILFLGMVLSFGSVKAAGYIALQSVMKDIGVPIKQIPAAGTAGIYALAGGLGIWATFSAALILNLIGS